jgi:hypothetical protein
MQFRVTYHIMFIQDSNPFCAWQIPKTVKVSQRYLTQDLNQWYYTVISACDSCWSPSLVTQFFGSQSEFGRKIKIHLYSCIHKFASVPHSIIILCPSPNFLLCLSCVQFVGWNFKLRVRNRHFGCNWQETVFNLIQTLTEKLKKSFIIYATL